MTGLHSTTGAAAVSPWGMATRMGQGGARLAELIDPPIRAMVASGDGAIPVRLADMCNNSQ